MDTINDDSKTEESIVNVEKPSSEKKLGLVFRPNEKGDKIKEQ